VETSVIIRAIKSDGGSQANAELQTVKVSQCWPARRRQYDDVGTAGLSALLRKFTFMSLNQFACFRAKQAP